MADNKTLVTPLEELERFHEALSTPPERFAKKTFQGSYFGNGSSQHTPFVNIGFKTSMVMIKTSSKVGDWKVFDSKNPPELLYNGMRVDADMNEKNETYIIWATEN